MHLRWSTDTGAPAPILTRLKRRVTTLTAPASVHAFKIGLTSNPARRARRSDYAGRYDEMVVVYTSPALDDVRFAEAELVRHNWTLCDNLVGGGGGAAALARPPYFLYVVRQFRRWPRR